jgi:hypothetical protein
LRSFASKRPSESFGRNLKGAWWGLEDFQRFVGLKDENKILLRRFKEMKLDDP